MKHLLKRLFGWCPQPQAPNYRVLRQYSKPILSLVIFSIIAISAIAASSLLLNQPLPPPPITPTPTVQPTSQPTSTQHPTASQTPKPTNSSTSIPTPTPAPAWHIENIANEGSFTSLALDANDNPIVSFSDLHGALKLARWNGTTWNITTVDSGNVGAYCSLALDSKGNPHISYRNYTDLNGPYDMINWSKVFVSLKYAWWNGTTWNTQTVDNNGRVGESCSLALDSSDRPHISYYDIENGNLKYASWTGTNWSIEVVDSEGDVGALSDLALDSNGNPHIGYLDFTKNYLKYASWTNMGWKIELVSKTTYERPYWGAYCSVVLDSADAPHISFQQHTPQVGGSLAYASWNGSGWSIETVASVTNASVGACCSLALDENEYPRISYLDNNGLASLRYAEWTGTAWKITTVDTDNVGYFSSLALDSKGNPHIGYMDGTYSRIKYSFFE